MTANSSSPPSRPSQAVARSWTRGIVDLLVASKTRAEPTSLGALTPRERDVLAQIAQGKSNSAIASSLVLSKRAVEKHIHSIFSKLGLSETEEVSRRVKATIAFLSEEREAGDGRPTGACS